MSKVTSRPQDMPLNVWAWLLDNRITALDLASQGGLLRLFCHAWCHPELKLCAEDLSMLSGMGQDYAHSKLRALLGQWFQPSTEEGWLVCKYLEEAAKKTDASRAARSKGGFAAREARLRNAARQGRKRAVKTTANICSARAEHMLSTCSAQNDASGESVTHYAQSSTAPSDFVSPAVGGFSAILGLENHPSGCDATSYPTIACTDVTTSVATTSYPTEGAEVSTLASGKNVPPFPPHTPLYPPNYDLSVSGEVFPKNENQHIRGGGEEVRGPSGARVGGAGGGTGRTGERNPGEGQSPETAFADARMPQDERDLFGQPIPPRKSLKPTQEQQDAATRVCDAYQRQVGSMHPRTAQADRNAARWLSRGYTEAELLKAVQNYAQHLERSQRPEEFRKSCSNFFGVSDPHFKVYLKGDQQGDYSSRRCSGSGTRVHEGTDWDAYG